MPLADSFRAGSAAQHREAETTRFIQALIDGKMTRPAHVAYLAAFWHVYRAMEKAITPAHPILACVYAPELWRSESFARDYACYTGGQNPPELMELPATRAYVTQIETLAQTWPAGLLAHHYTRYLGDLAGGQMLKGCVARALQPAAGQGLASYEFPAIPDLAAFRHTYRERLNAIPVSTEEEARLVAEVQNVFRLNQDLFVALEVYLN